MSGRFRCAAILTLLVLGMLAVCPGFAHVTRYPRLVQLVLEPEQIVLAVALTYHGGPQALRYRGRFDLDGSGSLSEPEQDRMKAWLSREALNSVELTFDGHPVELERTEAKLSLNEGSGTEHGDGFTFRTVLRLAVMPRVGSHELKLRDAAKAERGIVPWRIDLPVGWTLKDAVAEGAAVPPVLAGERSWQGAFSSAEGALVLDLEVSDRPGRSEAPEPPMSSSERASSLPGAGEAGGNDAGLLGSPPPR